MIKEVEKNAQENIRTLKVFKTKIKCNKQLDLLIPLNDSETMRIYA